MPSRAKTDNHLEVLEAIQDIGEAFASSLQLQPVLERIIYSAMQSADGDAGSVMLLTEDEEALVVEAAIGPRAEIILGQRQAADASVAGLAMRRKQPVLLKGRADGASGATSTHPREIARSVVVPLVVTGKLRGVLNVSTQVETEELPPEVVDLLRTLANQAAIMIEFARLFEDLQQKERRLEQFVDRFYRLAEQRRNAVDLSESRLQEIIAKAVHASAQAAPKPAAEEPNPMLQRLTHREQEVLSYIVQGLTNKEIATQLYLSPDTVKNHVVHIMEKLGAQDRTQAAVFAIRNGLVK
jgi:DNA-binding CsgD family transcriptional regulator/transcriptional regulator with GAF, ATPase, and Fis domain